MNKNDYISKGLIPIKDFLIRINLSLEDYLKLETVPFPVVLENGEVIYFKFNDIFVLDRNNTDVSSRKKIQIEGTLNQLYNSKEIFIDVRGFISKPSIDLLEIDNLNYRNKELILDRLNSKKDESNFFFTSETTGNSDQIIHDIFTGKECSTCSFNSYKFSSFDLISKINTPFLINYLNPNCSISYDKENQKFKYVLNSNFKQSETTMTQNSYALLTKANSVLEANKTAIIAATKLEVGGIALDLITDQIAKGIPEGFRPFIVNNPLFKIAVANAINLLVLQTGIEDPKLLILNDAMMTKSYSSMLESFDLTSLLSTVLTQIPAGKLKTLSENE